jgi:hypothetical protein
MDTNLNTPTLPVFVCSAVLALLAALGALINIPFVSGYAIWIAILAYIILAVGNLMRGI